jgi:hypothetical protein
MRHYQLSSNGEDGGALLPKITTFDDIVYQHFQMTILEFSTKLFNEIEVISDFIEQSILKPAGRK